MAEGLVTTAEAAGNGGYRAFLERDRMENKGVPLVQVSSRTIRYDKEDFDAYIARHRSTAAA